MTIWWAEFLYSGAFGWMKFDGRRWKPIEDAIVAEVVRQGVIEFHRTEARARRRCRPPEANLGAV